MSLGGPLCNSRTERAGFDQRLRWQRALPGQDVQRTAPVALIDSFKIAVRRRASGKRTLALV
jgi:hypothetical protein